MRLALGLYSMLLFGFKAAGLSTKSGGAAVTIATCACTVAPPVPEVPCSVGVEARPAPGADPSPLETDPCYQD